jgi:hypothetical protein
MFPLPIGDAEPLGHRVPGSSPGAPTNAAGYGIGSRRSRGFVTPPGRRVKGVNAAHLVGLADRA